MFNVRLTLLEVLNTSFPKSHSSEKSNCAFYDWSCIWNGSVQK